MALILGVVFALVVAAAIITSYLLTKYAGGDEPSTIDPPDIIDGESTYGSSALAYPTMKESDIKRITVNNKTSSYTLLRSEQVKGAFMLYYQDEEGHTQVYYPEICEQDSTFEYQDLYAIEGNDGYNTIYKLTYLCVALEYPYFTERIPLSKDNTERSIQLKEYGFDTEKAQTVTFDYVIKAQSENEKDTTVTHRITIGSKNITGTGYYYMVDDRDFVYNTNSNYFDYALLGFYSYVNGVLVSKGLEEDSSFEPYLTTNYKQWVNTMHDKEGEVVTDTSKVIAFTEMLVPIESTADTEINSGNKNGYSRENYDKLIFDLSTYNGKADYKRLVNALVGKKVGKYYDTTDENDDPKNQITFTLTTDSKAIDLKEKDTRKYSYYVVAIESIITDDAEFTENGTPVLDNDLLKITYYLDIDGKEVSSLPYHAVIDLSSSGIPADAVDKFRTLKVGDLGDESFGFTVDYTKKNSVNRNIKYVITEIMEIYDKDGKAITKIAEDSIVTYHYRFEIDGVLSEEEYSAAIDFSKDETEEGKKVKEKLIGKKRGKKLSIVADEYTEYCEYLLDFITYNIASIEYFITSEMVSAFRFQNNSERDPFYGESIYENLMENKYQIYGLNSSVCEQVVKILGGIGDTTGASQGLHGIETVAVGITPEIMEKYGLYAHTIYFELPRGITVIESGEDDVIDDYSWYETLGFTLYVSEEQPDGTRYVGSDAYDIVATVNASDFVFLKYDFVNFWARNNLMLVDIKNMESLELEFGMTDLKGKYKFDLNHRTLYYTSDGKGYFTEPESYKDTFNFITVNVTPSGECTENELTKYISENGLTSLTLAELYKQVIGNGEDIYIGLDTYGTTYYKQIIQLIYNTKYTGTLTEEEQREALESAPMVMKFSLKLDSSSYRYVYEFYRSDDRKVMVRIYKADAEGNMMTTPVSDFYISTYAFKKIANGFVSLLNAEEFELNSGYDD